MPHSVKQKNARGITKLLDRYISNGLWVEDEK
jgi:hypothetical protein